MPDTIAVIDDREAKRFVLTRLLKQEGFAVREAGSGQEALALAAELPDLMVLDIRLPDRSGFDVCRQIKSDPKTAHVLVLLLSAHLTSGADRVTGLESGADGYLVHPVAAPELMATVRALLRIRHAERDRIDMLERAEQARAEAEGQRERLRTLFLQAPAMINILRGPDHVFELVHPLVRKYVGDRPLEGLPLAKAIPELADQPYMAALNRVYRAGEPFTGTEVEVKLPTASGGSQTRYLNLVLQPLRAPSGEVEGVVSFGIDVTEEVHARSRLEQSEQRFRFLADTIPALVWTNEAAGAPDYYNARWTEFAGIPPESLGDSWQLLHPDDVARIRAAWEHSLRTGDRFEQQARLRRKDGAFRWHLMRAVLLRDSWGRLVKWFGTATDIDDQKRTEEALQRTGEFREQLLGIVGHDLRNPLASITMAAATMLKRGGLAEADARTAGRIATSADRMARIIDQVLDFTRSRLGGGISVSLSHVDLGQVCRQVIEELELAHPDRQVRLEVSGDARGQWDGQRMGQVVSNLVGNAVAHGTPSGPVLVRLEGRVDDVVLSVHNEGPAIPPDVLPTLFEPFRTGKPRSPGRLGLGLYIVSQIVEAHGGAIAVRSDESNGTTFTLRLPRNASVHVG